MVVAEIVHLDLSHANAVPLVGFRWCEWLLVVPRGPMGAGTSVAQDWEYPGGSSPAFTRERVTSGVSFLSLLQSERK